MGSSGLEPPTSRLSGARSNHLSYEPMFSACWGSYALICPSRIVRSLKTEQHTYGRRRSRLTTKRRECVTFLSISIAAPAFDRPFSGSTPGIFRRLPFLMPHYLHRKEVIQPHLPIRLPCYDLTPVANPTFGSALLAVKLLTSGITGSHGVTGGVYKARERIHRGMLIRDY